MTADSAIEPEWIAIDWGTSNVRAWGVGTSDTTVFERRSDAGMGTLEPKQYPAVLDALLGDAVPADATGIDVMICGMTGARQGWAEAPYLDTPADLRQLGSQATIPPNTDSRFAPRILAGVCQKTPGEEDVMRGEETQVLGFLDSNPGYRGVLCMPGTHSKWVRVEDFTITGFSTVMTGELFEALRCHTILRHTSSAEESDEEGFLAGLDKSLERPEALTGNLFAVRAASLLAGREPAWLTGYLSGLLIGAEIAANRTQIGESRLPLIGAPKLCGLYAMALGRAGFESEVVDATGATLAGLARARRHLRDG